MDNTSFPKVTNFVYRRRHYQINLLP